MSGSTASNEAQELLVAWRQGDLAARERLFSLFYADLRQAASAMLRNERRVSLSVGDLVHETVLKLIRLGQIDWQDRAHFMALTSVMMRRALVDHVRGKRRAKRDHQKVELVTNIPGVGPTDLEEINDALERLARVDRQRAEIVEMRYFGGMEMADIALVLGLSESTVKRRWQAARAWLYEALQPEHG